MNCKDISEKYMIDENKLKMLDDYGLFDYCNDEINTLKEILTLEKTGMSYEEIKLYLNSDCQKRYNMLNELRTKILQSINCNYKRIDVIDYLLNK